jgi:hypothetical protein
MYGKVKLFLNHMEVHSGLGWPCRNSIFSIGPIFNLGKERKNKYFQELISLVRLLI